jgi:hypothetical protein
MEPIPNNACQEVCCMKMKVRRMLHPKYVLKHIKPHP